MARPASSLMVSEDTAGTVCVLAVDGVLDSSTYLKLRDAVICAALEEPQAVLVDVNALDVPAFSAWSAFTSARWHVRTWPDVPIVLVCGQVDRRAAIEGTGATRYVPVHATTQAALAALTDDRRARQHAVPAVVAAARAGEHRQHRLIETITATLGLGLGNERLVVLGLDVEGADDHDQDDHRHLDGGDHRGKT